VNSVSEKAFALLSLFASTGTLFCCALPALFVSLGAGAAFAGLTAAFPPLYWVGMYKGWIFLVGGLFIAAAFLLGRQEPVSCEATSSGPTACETTRSWSKPLLYMSSSLYAVGAFFAYAAPHLF
jgi:hypothetical protein